MEPLRVWGIKQKEIDLYFRSIYMNKTLAAVVITITAFMIATAQKIEKPTLTSKPLTDAQTMTVREGIGLHDKKDFTGAVAKYKQVLAENPDSTLALYELALSYYNMGDTENALKTSFAGTRYDSEELPLFYGLIANMKDDSGKPDEAIKIYQTAIKMLDGNKEFVRHLSSLHFNLGVTYARQKQAPEARAELKQAIRYNYSYASPHYVLSEVLSALSSGDEKGRPYAGIFLSCAQTSL